MMIKLRKALRSRGIPLTHQRLAIYELLKKSRAHPSAEMLHARLRVGYPSLSLATVYKTLRTLERLRLITLVNLPHAQARYDAITKRHHHAICETCGRIIDLFDARLDKLPVPKGAVDFKISGHSVHFRGLCARCKMKSRTRRNS